MASSIFRKLLKDKSSLRIVNAFHKSPPPSIVAPLLSTHLAEDNILRQPATSPILFLGPSRVGESMAPSHSSYFYPTFPFGCCSNPISSTEWVQSESDDGSVGISQMIWADSVKKKRKKKMNKHKLKKLRKRMRKKS